MTTIKQQIKFCQAGDGGRIAVATTGKGPPLVCAAHWVTHVEFDARSPVWKHWLRELSRGHTYIRYDQRGCGLSDWTPASVTFEAMIGDLEAVVDALALKRFALFGLCQGAAVAIAYAARHPERVSQLVLLGAFAQGRLRRDYPARQSEEAEMLVRLTGMGWGCDNPAFRQLFAMLAIPEGTPEQYQWFNEFAPLMTASENAAAIRQALLQLDLTAAATAVRAPTLVLHAREDAVTPFEEGRRLAALIPSARFVPMEGRNHVLLETEPAWPQFLAEVRGFLGNGADGATVSGCLPMEIELTRAELQVLDLVARGHDNATIAARLGKREKTVRNQVSSVLSKLRVHTRAEAVAVARDAGIGGPVG